jgi:uncharacterized membrane protein YjjB (DUF3815 family)
MVMIVFVFVLLFAVVMCSTTDATVQEILVGTAAYVIEGVLEVVEAYSNRYGAFLVSFIGNLNGNQSCACGNSVV